MRESMDIVNQSGDEASPEAVFEVLHELMHLREPNHSRRFWRHVAAVCPDFQQSRRWLRTHESLLALRER